MREWPRVTLGQACDHVDGVIKTGPFGAQLHKSDYVEDLEGKPVVMPKDILDGKIVSDSIARIGPDTADRLAIHQMSVGDIVMARRGDIGRRALIDSRTVGWLCGTGSLRVSLPGSGIDPTFLYYYLGSYQAIGWLQGQAVGATMPNLNTDIIRRMAIPLPPLPVQRKIAAVLAAYDELIENNLRRIEILEEMAQAVYREWFVEFRFPGHEDVVMVESELGPIPEGWEVEAFGDHAGSRRLNVDPQKHPDTEFLHYSFAAFDGGGLPAAVLGCELKSGKLAVEQPSVLLAKLNPRIPRVWLVAPSQNRSSIASSEFLVLVPVPETPLSFVYTLIRGPDFAARLAALAGGTSTSHQRLKLRDLEGVKIPIPPPNQLQHFDRVVSPMYQLVPNLLEQNANLRATRDLLLPKLVSGQIDVSDLDIDTDWLVA